MRLHISEISNAGINKATVYNWIKKLDKKTGSSACSQEEVPEKPQSVDVIEMDELFAYTKAKKQNLRDNIGDKKTATNRRF